MTELSQGDHPSPSLKGNSSGRSMLLSTLVVVVILLGLVGGFWIFMGRRANPIAGPAGNDLARHAKSPPLEVPVELQPVRYSNPGYVGAKVCGECHQARLDEFRKTRHFRACCTPEGDQAPVGFEPGTAEFTSSNWPFRFQPVREAGGYLEKITGETPSRRIDERHRIDLVYGSKGKADEVYFTWQENRLFELPFAWLHPWNCWGKQIYGDVGDNVLRTTTPRCLECHTTYFEHVAGTENEYHRESILPGVTCENCHGPGREHVDHHRTHPGLKEAFAIVHPGHLSRERQMDLCAQCHSPALHHRDKLLSYRPGDDLDKHFRSLTIEGIENDHVANQTKYLRRSKCFQGSDSLTCHTCHDPHRSTDPKVAGDACAKCHQPTACHAHERLPVAVRGQCVDCHMPNYYRVAVKFRIADDEYVFPMRPREHRIGIYPRAHQEVLLGWHKGQSTPTSRDESEHLTKELVESWTKEGDNLRAADRFVAAIGAYREALRFAPESAVRSKIAHAIQIQSELDAGRLEAQQLVAQGRTGEAIESLENLLKLSPSQATVHGRLGTMYEIKGQHEKALEHWAAVNRYDPDDAYGHNMRGWTAYVNGRYAEAIEAFRRADALLPATAEINYRWGLACLGAKDAKMAAERLRVSLKANPEHVGAMQAMSHALREQGKFPEAVSFAAEAARRSNYQNFDVLISWIEASLDAHRADDVQEAIERAELLVHNVNQRMKLDELRQRLLRE
ncbi:MAG: mtrA [Planctomycetaceae bacterium]|nr:mtrA [Planctomycetaceae bacterium]